MVYTILGQYLAGLLSGAILSWCGASIYFSNCGEKKVSDSSPDDVNGKGVIVPAVPGKTIIVYIVDDVHLERFKAVVEPVMKHICSPTEGVKAEIDEMFAEAISDNDKKISKERVIAKDVDSTSTGPRVTPGGGYRTLRQFENMGSAYRSTPAGMLTRQEEMTLIHQFAGILRMGYYEALAKVQESGFSLHPLYLSYGEKMPAAKYSPKTIGVRICDPNFDTAHSKPSPGAIITEIVDIGGIDFRDAGIINL